MTKTYVVRLVKCQEYEFEIEGLNAETAIEFVKNAPLESIEHKKKYDYTKDCYILKVIDN